MNFDTQHFMNDSPEGAWFFTREGERLGPVSFAELREKARAAGLDPRLDMVWTKGMDGWKPAGEIQGLFEKRAASVPQETLPSLAPPADPYQPPREESVAETMSSEGGWPGARRRSYLFMTIVFPILWAMGFPIGLGFLGATLGAEITSVVALAGGFLPAILGFWFSLQRLANLGMTRWWFLGNLVPILNFWVGYRCFACPGGYAYHKKMDGAGIFLAIVYWLLIVVTLLFVAAMLALLLGAVNDPELQEQLRKIFAEIQKQAAAQ